MFDQIDPQNTVFLVALNDELPAKCLPGWRICHTGVGKINATVATMEALELYTPKTIINFGTAGALKEGISGICPVVKLLQRDMDVRGLGFALGQTPFEEELALELPHRLGSATAEDTEYQGYSCSTGDNFVQAPPELKSDLVDMEAYAIAKVCRQKGIQFHCFKYVSDKADDSAAEDWSASLEKSAQEFAQYFLSRVTR